MAIHYNIRMRKRSVKKIMKTKDAPATMGVILKFRAEMNSKYSSLDKRMDSFDKRMDSLDKRMDSFDKRMDSFDKRMDSFNKRMDSYDKKLESSDKKTASGFDRVLAEIHRIGLLVEEQNARNRVVFDSLNLFKMRLDRIEGISE